MKNFSTQKERILQFIEYKGISKNKFYIDTGISNGILDKKSGLSMETIEKFYSIFPEINLEWLVTGQGSMLKEPTQPAVSFSQPQQNDKYTASLEKQVAQLEKINALQEEKIAELEEKLKFAEFRDKKDMDFKIKAQRKEKKEKDEIIIAQNNTINELNEENNALKSRYLPPDEPLQPSQRV